MTGVGSLFARLAAVEAAVAAELASAPPDPFAGMADRHAAAAKRAVRAYEAVTTPEQRYQDYLDGMNARTNLLPRAGGIPATASEQECFDLWQLEREKPFLQKRKLKS